jgi:hypothetical protein
MKLNEGGNEFKDAEGKPATQRINQTDVKPTVAWLEQLTGLKLLNNMLGSTGVAATSGDLDLAVDAGKVDKAQFRSKLESWATSHGLEPKEWVSATGINIHLKTPIAGNPDRGYVQTDFMFLQKPDFQKWYLTQDHDSNYKGVTRAILLASIAKSMGYKINQNVGLVNRATNELVTDNPDEVAKLFIPGATDRTPLGSVEKIMKALARDPKREQKIADFRDYAAKNQIQFEAIEENSTHWIARLRDRIVNQGMEVIVENPYREYAITEGVRIEHPEDLVFDYGSKGISQALAGIQSAAAEPAKTNTIKWDGKPAIIFGRNERGEFVLTDKGGFLKSGGVGLATSPAQMSDLLAQRRGGGREELADLYAQLFPLIRRTVPQNFRGYVQGDLLFHPQKPWKLENGNYVFTPNTVTYKVDANTPVGKEIGNSTVGIAVHTMIGKPGDAAKPTTSAVLDKAPGVVVLDATLQDTGSKIELNQKLVKSIQDVYNNYAPEIDAFFNPAELRARKITNTPALIKQYINSKVRAGNYSNMVKDFGPWITAKEKTKAPRIIEWMNENKGAVAALFSSFLNISQLKNDLIRQLDAQDRDVKADIDGEPGHEGYVGADLKFVDRMRFSQANFAKNNPEQS